MYKIILGCFTCGIFVKSHSGSWITLCSGNNCSEITRNSDNFQNWKFWKFWVSEKPVLVYFLVLRIHVSLSAWANCWNYALKFALVCIWISASLAWDSWRLSLPLSGYTQYTASYILEMCDTGYCILSQDVHYKLVHAIRMYIIVYYGPQYLCLYQSSVTGLNICACASLLLQAM